MIWRGTYQPLVIEGLSLPRKELLLIAWDIRAFSEVQLWLKMLHPFQSGLGCFERADFADFLAPSLADNIEILESAEWVAAIGAHPGKSILAYADFAHVGLPTEESLEDVLNRITSRAE